MSVYFFIAFKNLIQARRRTFFLGTAIATVTLLLVLLLSLSQGLRDTIVRAATTLSAGHVNVAGFYKASAGDAAPIVKGVHDLKQIIVQNTPNLDYVVDRHRGWARVVSVSASVQIGLNGIDVDEDPRFLETIQLAQENEYREDGGTQTLGSLSDLRKKDSLLMFAAQAKRLGVRVGDEVTLVIETMDGRRNTGDVTVVAIAKDLGMMSNWSMFVPKETILELYRLQPDTTGAIMLYLDDISESEATMGRLREVLAANGYVLMDHDPQAFWGKFERVSAEDWLGQKIDLTIWSDEVSFMDFVLTAVSTVSFLLMSVLVVIIVIGIMNSMHISVRERTREIGTVRSIGMSRGGVLMMFLFEALVLGFGATVLGGLLGAIIASAINAAHIEIPSLAVQALLMSDVVHLSVQPLQIFYAVLAFTSVTAVAALLPAVRAARLHPIDAIRSVG
jgi:putative ABC transport system permease protein